MMATFIFYRRINFHKHWHFWCAFLLMMIYLLLRCSFRNKGSQNIRDQNSKWPHLEGRSLQPNCSLPNGGLDPHVNLTAFGLHLASKMLPRKGPGVEALPTRQILLMAYHRGGSTFLSEIFNAYPGAFLHFEPLQVLTGNKQVRSRKEITTALGLLKNLYRCRLGRLISMHPNWARSCLWYLEFNLSALANCPIRAHFCYSPAFFDAWCASHTIHIAKVLRLRLDHTKHLLRELPDLRVIYLTRDPRGLYNSRHKWKWCNETRSCIDPTTYCKDMRKDLAAAERLRKQFPNRVMEISYHDLATDTENQVGKLLDFLELSRSTAVNEFIRMHTKTSKQGNDADSLLTTYRDSKNRPFLWRKQLSVVNIARVEAACSDVIQHLGFNVTNLFK